MIVWLASYPRSGNTLLRIVINHAFGYESHSIHGDGLDIAANKELSDIVGHRNLTGADLDSFRSDESLVFIKTHCLPDDRISSEDKVIYIIRDGRDSVVSFFHYLESFTRKEFRMEDVICGNAAFGTWAGHVSAWSPARRNGCLLLRFEDIVSSFENSVSKISDYIGKSIGSKRVPEFSDLRSVSPKFFRRGKAGGWVDELEDRHHKLFWLVNGDMMLENDYEDSLPSDLFGKPNLLMEIAPMIRYELDIVRTMPGRRRRKRKRNTFAKLRQAAKTIVGGQKSWN